MPYHTGNIHAIGSSLSRTRIRNSSIMSSTIDMNMNNITSVKDPEKNQDAATKWYVDERMEKAVEEVSNQFQGFEIRLEGTNFSDIAYIKSGSYIVTIFSNDGDGYPTATFSISKASDYRAAMIHRMTSDPGLDTYEQLDLQWPVNDVLTVRKTGPGFDGNYIVNLNIKNVSALPAPPVAETDVATKAYVDMVIREQFEVKFGGQVVLLEGIEWVNLINLRLGSYLVTVTAINMDGAPTSTFSISKNSLNSEGHIVVVTKMKGFATEENLELIWDINKLPQLRKTGVGYDGNYLVDMNLRNFSSYPVPTIPSDSATMSFVEQYVTQIFNNKFNGIIVPLVGTDFSYINYNIRPGAYQIMVSSLVPGGACAAFSVSKNSVFISADVLRLTSSFDTEAGSDGVIELMWEDNNFIAIRKTTIFHDGDYIIDFNLKNITPEPPVPILPSDSATKEYVDFSIEEKLDIKFGGIEVTLTDTDFVKICPLRPGTYLISVHPVIDGFPTAGFFVSKSSINSPNADIAKITSSFGVNNPPTQLELSWPENDQLLIRKSTSFFDGKYIVDMNLRNHTSVPTALFPTDAATRAYVDQQIHDKMKAEYGGITVVLSGTDFSNVCDLRSGSYIVTISPQIEYAPSATFSISKSSQDSTAHVVKLTSSHGNDTLEELELIWNNNSKLKLKKSGFFYDGEYLVDFNLKNFTSLPEPVISSDAATKSFVERAIQDHMQTKWSGKLVELNGTNWSRIAPLKLGSYTINVTSYVRNGPTASFTVCKSSESFGGSIVELGSCPGLHTFEKLEFIWSKNEPLMIRKTGPSYDGPYMIDFNLKNFSELDPPELPSDVVTKEYVDSSIENNMESKWSGVKVLLTDTTWTEVVSPKPGSYTINVSPVLMQGAPTASFVVSKNSMNSTAMINRITSDPDENDNDVHLELLWNSNEKLKLRKTGPWHDGMYIVDFNIKNFTPNVEETIPSDIATVYYVDKKVQDFIQPTYTGITINLSQTNWCPVIPMKPGSYSVNVSPLAGIRGPAAQFSISKSHAGISGTIVKVSSCSGEDENCQLDLSWNENQKIMIRKTNIFHDGEYLVNFNLLNFTTTENPTLPSDIATKEYVDSFYDTKFNGVTVSLVGDSISDVCPLRCGSYFISISSLNIETQGPTALFCLSKVSQDSIPMITRLSEMPGIGGLYGGDETKLHIMWDSMKPLQLMKTDAFHDGIYLVNFNIKNFPDLPIMDVVSSDIATKDYVDIQIRENLTNKLVGQTFNLFGTEFTDLFPMRPGSYFISINPLIENGPTASFIVAKSNSFDTGSVVKLASHPGHNSEEQLELVWQPNSKIQLRKSGFAYDGLYLVDCNLKNFTHDNFMGNIVPPDTELASKNFVTELVEEKIKNMFSGVEIQLNNTDYTEVISLRPGSYTINVSSIEDGGPCGSFSVSKSTTAIDASVVDITSCPGTETGELLQLIWPAHSTILIKKSSFGHDGRYLVDFNLKNVIPPMQQLDVLIPSDIVNKEYVDTKIFEAMNLKFGGTKFRLEGTRDTLVLHQKPGSYLISISGVLPDGGSYPTANFSISNKNTSTIGSVVRLTSYPGDYENTELEVSWNGTDLLVRKTSEQYDGMYILDFSNKNITTFEDPTFPNDVATMSYVQQLIQDNLTPIYSGISVNLESSDFSIVTSLLKNGSYMIAISSDITNAPLATFNISKNSNDIDASIVKLTSCSSPDNGQLDLIWSANDYLKLRKTTNSYDGVYLVDFNMKNFSLLPSPTTSDNVATRDYVDGKIQELVDWKFTGVPVELLDTELTSVISLKVGSYVVTISSQVHNGPSATFNISRSSLDVNPHIVRTTMSPGVDSDVQLELFWNESGYLLLRKTGPFYNGVYRVDLNLKNITLYDFPDIPSSSPIPNTSDDLSVVLTDTEFSNVASFKPGSYLFTVSGSEDGFPTATFSVSKSSVDSTAHVVRVTGLAGKDSDIFLEMAWFANSKIMLRKTGLFYNGVYIINVSKQNFLSTESVSSDWDVIGTVTPIGGMGQIQMYEMFLLGTDPVSVTFIPVGIYFLFLSSVSIPGGRYIASYHINKLDVDNDGEIAATSLSNTFPYFEINIIWHADGTLQICKNTDDYDGKYIVKII